MSKEFVEKIKKLLDSEVEGDIDVAIQILLSDTLSFEDKKEFIEDMLHREQTAFSEEEKRLLREWIENSREATVGLKNPNIDESSHWTHWTPYWRTVVLLIHKACNRTRLIEKWKGKIVELAIITKITED